MSLRLEEKRLTEGKTPILYSVGVAYDEDSSVKSLVELVALSDHRAEKDRPHGDGRQEDMPQGAGQQEADNPAKETGEG